MSCPIPLRPVIEQRIRNIVRGDVPWSLRYLDEFVKLRCSPDLLALGVFPNAKEITESMAAYHTVRQHLRDYHSDDPHVSVFVIGDGNTPRTAALFAFRTRWTCYSIDPRLPRDKTWDVKRLHVLPAKVEDVHQGDALDAQRFLIVAVHSHAVLAHALERFRCPPERRAVVAIQCCVPQVLPGRAPDLEYRDWAVLSPENLVKVWRRA